MADSQAAFHVIDNRWIVYWVHRHCDAEFRDDVPLSKWYFWSATIHQPINQLRRDQWSTFSNRTKPDCPPSGWNFGNRDSHDFLQWNNGQFESAKFCLSGIQLLAALHDWSQTLSTLRTLPWMQNARKCLPLKMQQHWHECQARIRPLKPVAPRQFPQSKQAEWRWKPVAAHPPGRSRT